MSYRSFKRLLGESSLERKSRFLLGAVTLVLISGSFYLYARLTAGLAYDATSNSSRILASQIIYNYHVFDEKAKAALQSFQEGTEVLWPEALKGYGFRLYKPHSRVTEFKATPEEKPIIDKFLDDP